MLSLPSRPTRLWFSSRARFSTANTFLGHSSRDNKTVATRNADLRTRLLEELKASLKVWGFLRVQSGF